jgi:hypothetical protein
MHHVKRSLALSAFLAVCLVMLCPPSSGAQTLSPVHRFFNTVAGTHFYTTSTDEAAWVMMNIPVFNYEGMGYYTQASAGGSASPVYRLYTTYSGTHFYTIWGGEKDWIVANLPHYRYEGIAYYAYPQTAAGLTPLYRFFNTIAGNHFFTVWDGERDWVIANLPHYRYEGTAYYVKFPERSAEGIWTGTVTSGGMTSDVIGFITASGESQFIVLTGGNYDSSLSGYFSSFNNSVTGLVRRYVLSGPNPSPTLAATGMVVAGSTLTGSFSGASMSGTFSLTFDPTYNRPSAASSLAGTWNYNQSGYVFTMSVDGVGSLFGNDNYGCRYSGTFSLVDSARNAYGVNLSISDCVLAGTYRGVGVLADFQSTNDGLIFQVSNRDRVFMMIAAR